MKTYLLFIAITAMLLSCTKQQKAPLIPDANFSKTINGKAAKLYTLSNSQGTTVQLTNYGARIVALWVSDSNNDLQDVVWGFSSIDEYLESSDIYCGPIVGRFGNRINKGQFTLNDKEYQLTINNGINHLHGGTKGFESKVWNAEKQIIDGQETVKMTYFSKDGEEGYPGNLTLSVNYSLNDNNELILDYLATTDAPTIINPTSHVYFNLSGTSDNTILSHVLKINASSFTPTDDGLIPTGIIAPVKGTPLDFSSSTAIGDRINENYVPLTYGKGYDHNYVLNKNDKTMTEAAVIFSPESGIKMTVITDQLALQFYSGNFMDGTITGKRGDIHSYRTGFALEAQNYPDAPNHENFPSAILNPGETYTQKTIYAFSVIK